MRICILDGKTLGDGYDFSMFENFGEVVVYPESERAQVKNRIKGFDIVIDNKVIIDREAIFSCDELKMIALLSTGTNVVDIKAAEEKGIAVCNVAGYSTASVVQHTFAMLFELWERLGAYDSFVKGGEYTKSGMFTSFLKPFNEIRGKTWGIIGCGTIGRAAARAAQAFGAEVVFYSISGKGDTDGFKSVSLDELLEKSDIVSLHCALSEKTKGIIGKGELNKMKKTAVLINVGRGGLVDEYALAEAVDTGKIDGACIDVFEKEPLNYDNPLLNMEKRDKIVLTPHIAWASVESRQRLVSEVYKNIDAFLCGKNRNRVV